MHAPWDYGHQFLLDLLEGGLMLWIQELLCCKLCLLTRQKVKLQVSFESTMQYAILPLVGAL